MNHSDATRPAPAAPSRDAVEALVCQALRDLLVQRSRLPKEPLDGGTRLIGRNSVLDSLGLVTLIVDVEQKLQETHGVSVTLADERAMSQKNSPFRSVASLTDYIVSLV